MRLIDADALTDGKGVFSDVIHIDFKKGGGYIMVDDLLNILDNQPTAYDVDKVVESIEEKILNTSDTETGISARMAFGKSVEIVKSGGIE